MLKRLALIARALLEEGDNRDGDEEEDDDVMFTDPRSSAKQSEDVASKLKVLADIQTSLNTRTNRGKAEASPIEGSSAMTGAESPAGTGAKVEDAVAVHATSEADATTAVAPSVNLLSHDSPMAHHARTRSRYALHLLASWC